MAFGPKIAGCESDEFHGLGPVVRGECRIGLLQGTFDNPPDRSLEFGPQRVWSARRIWPRRRARPGCRLAGHVSHPLVPAPQHDAQQPFDPSDVVVQVSQQLGQRIRYIIGRSLGIQGDHRQAGRAVI